MALAGPAANFLILLLAALLIRVGLSAHVFAAPEAISFSHLVEPAAPGLYLFLAGMLSIFFSLNLLLCVFNLLPLPPLDGSAALLAVAPSAWAGTLAAIRRHPTVNLIGLYIAWQLIGPLFRPIQIFAVQLLYPGAQYF
jgi:Zn-dependent protease